MSHFSVGVKKSCQEEDHFSAGRTEVYRAQEVLTTEQESGFAEARSSRNQTGCRHDIAQSCSGRTQIHAKKWTGNITGICPHHLWCRCTAPADRAWDVGRVFMGCTECPNLHGDIYRVCPGQESNAWWRLLNGVQPNGNQVDSEQVLLFHMMGPRGSPWTPHLQFEPKKFLLNGRVRVACWEARPRTQCSE